MISKRNFSTAKRQALAAKGHALPDGSYPITDAHDLRSAITLALSGHGNVAAAKKLIKRRAKDLGLENTLPASLSEDGEKLAGIGLAQRPHSTNNNLRDKKGVGKSLDTRAPLDRSPNKNWVENAGGLPMYIRRIANHLNAEQGMTISHAIATAVNVVKKMCASGDTNWPGKQNVNAGSHAEACAAVVEWERKKASARVSKGIKGRKLTDSEVIKDIREHYKTLSPAERVELGARLLGMSNMHRKTKGLEISDKEFSKLASELEDPDDPDTETEEDWVDFSVEGDISKTDTDKRLVFGWCSVGIMPDGSVVDDKQGDVLDDVEEIEKAAYEFVLNSRDGGEMHIRKGVSTLVESFVSTPEKWKAMGIPEGTLPVGWWVGFRVADDEVWKSVREGKYKMFSVHGRGTRKALD